MNDRADKLDFTHDTINPIPSMVLPQGGRTDMEAHTSETASYFSGGGGPGNSYKSYTEKITYATDASSAVPGGNMSQEIFRILVLYRIQHMVILVVVLTLD